MNQSQQKDGYVQRLGLHRYNKIQLPTFKEYIAKMNMFMILLNKDEANQSLTTFIKLKDLNSSLNRISSEEDENKSLEKNISEF